MLITLAQLHGYADWLAALRWTISNKSEGEAQGHMLRWFTHVVCDVFEAERAGDLDAKRSLEALLTEMGMLSNSYWYRPLGDVDGWVDGGLRRMRQNINSQVFGQMSD